MPQAQLICFSYEHGMTDDTRDLIRQLAVLAIRKHYNCEDSWYSCPQSEGGSANEHAGTKCDCGAAEHNAKVDAIAAELLGNPVISSHLP